MPVAPAWQTRTVALATGWPVVPSTMSSLREPCAAAAGASARAASASSATSIAAPMAPMLVAFAAGILLRRIAPAEKPVVVGIVIVAFPSLSCV